ncbi:DUF6688 domain-containing protein [Actinotignum schaalii]|uniref:DUF6688 domain-containing protein n=1 Tax=Actinotignum schaalii TaxID=59505 RepID=UPI00040D4854|nr:DUF6688 family protein [Actinotignum schaalii]AIE82266.1 hypothetical protein FB03_02135 [Actinotignum schaalii]WQN44299.1 DUF6688 family protein [Actinotignum schaalii]
MPEARKRNFVIQHPYLAQIFLAYAIAIPGYLLYTAYTGQLNLDGLWDPEAFIFLLVFFTILPWVTVYPIILTCYQVIALIIAIRGKPLPVLEAAHDVWTIFLALSFHLALISMRYSVVFYADWSVQLVNDQTHTPIRTGFQPFLLVLCIVCFAAFLYVRLKPISEIPPLLTVLCFACIYLGNAIVIAWTIQTFRPDGPENLILLLPVIAVVLISAKTIIMKIHEFHSQAPRAVQAAQAPQGAQGTEEEREAQEIQATQDSRDAGNTRATGSGVLAYLEKILSQARNWPLLALLGLIPVLGIFLLILVLFGQEPNAAIKAFTETSDWTLSQRISPPNTYYDEHYLCTVAAGGHPAVVKPIRDGVRGGHRITVNRQLLIANAFEQILEEKTPRAHRAIRSFYNRYGFPLSRLIRSRLAADVVWIAMKPLEWLFLAVIYLVDARPEDRIAIQYTGRRREEFTAG